MFDRDSSSVVRSLTDLLAFRSNPESKVYQHQSRNGGILEVARSTGSLRKNSKRHCCWGVNTRLLMEQVGIEHAPNGSLLRISPSLTRWWITYAIYAILFSMLQELIFVNKKWPVRNSSLNDTLSSTTVLPKFSWNRHFVETSLHKPLYKFFEWSNFAMWRFCVLWYNSLFHF